MQLFYLQQLRLIRYLLHFEYYAHILVSVMIAVDYKVSITWRAYAGCFGMTIL